MIKRRLERGDTIVEVVIAFAIFSLAAIGAIQVLSKGVATTQRNLELTLVRQQVDSQAEMLRYIRDSPSQQAVWRSLVADTALTTAPHSLSDSCSVGSSAFVVQTAVGDNPAETSFSRRSIVAQDVSLGDGQRGEYTYSHMNYSGASLSGASGLWVEAARAEGDSSGPKAYDFYIHSCWDSVGVTSPMTSGTIVRIYE